MVLSGRITSARSASDLIVGHVDACSMASLALKLVPIRAKKEPIRHFRYALVRYSLHIALQRHIRESCRAAHRALWDLVQASHVTDTGHSAQATQLTGHIYGSSP